MCLTVTWIDMTSKKLILLLFTLLFSCKSKFEKIFPVYSAISESIYASGLMKSANQYEAFVTVNGTINKIFVAEGDKVKKGDPILSIANDAQRFGKENAKLAAEFADFSKNTNKLKEAKIMTKVARDKMKNDSLLYTRQKDLWSQQIGTKVEFEARTLAYENSRAAYYSAKVNYHDLLRQLDFSSEQAKKNLLISSKLESDYTLLSKIDGVVYSLPKELGEIVSAQTPLAIIGDAEKFILEMQVDEYDILKIKKGLPVLVTMDSYKGKVFEATITKIYPIMDQRSKTFLVESKFNHPPAILYPNISFEANIILQTKSKALLIPRNFIVNEYFVVKSNYDTVKVVTGLKDFQKIEILKGITTTDELIKPK
jgi:HlyD family secretion protein